MNEALTAGAQVEQLTPEELDQVFGGADGPSWVCQVQNGHIKQGSCVKVD